MADERNPERAPQPMSTPLRTHEWLSKAIKQDISRFAGAFEEIGCDDEDDVREMTAKDVDDLRTSSSGDVEMAEVGGS